jgi:hypothetical protein
MWVIVSDFVILFLFAMGMLSMRQKLQFHILINEVQDSELCARVVFRTNMLRTVQNPFLETW